MLSIILLVVVVFLSYKISPREREADAHVHGAGQVGLLAALALFGVDYFTSFYYATGEMMSALHPYGLQKYGYIAVGVIALANFIFGALYIYSLGVFNEGGGSFTASMRYLGPSISLIVAVVLIQDYIFTIVVSSLSGVEQLLSLKDAAGIPWIWHFLIGALLAGLTWYLTIRGRGESARIVFAMLGVFVLLTLTMATGLFTAHFKGIPAFTYPSTVENPSLGRALYQMLSASMKGLVALSGLEAMSNGIQFVMNEDAGIISWGKKHLPRWKRIWDFYSGGAGIGRLVQSSFLFYGGITTLALASFAIRFGAFDGINGRSLVGNLAYIGFGQLPGGIILFWAYQILAVLLLAAASMTAFQDLQAMTWRNVAIGEIPEVVVYRNPAGTFTRPVTAAVIAAILIQFLVHGRSSAAIPFYGVGVFMPIMAMGLAIRKHIRKTAIGRARVWGSFGASLAAALAGIVFVGQIIGKWEEGGWIVLISLSILILVAHAILVSPIGYRNPKQIYRIIREKSRVHGPMGSIVEWQSLKTQEYRYKLLIGITRFAELFGLHRPTSFEPPMPAGDYDELANLTRYTRSATILEQYLDNQPQPDPRLGGRPSQTAAPVGVSAEK